MQTKTEIWGSQKNRIVSSIFFRKTVILHTVLIFLFFFQDINTPKYDSNKNPLNHNGPYPGNNLETEEPRPLSRVNLRDNQLKGSIILGNYGVIFIKK